MIYFIIYILLVCVRVYICTYVCMYVCNVRMCLDVREQLVGVNSFFPMWILGTVLTNLGLTKGTNIHWNFFLAPFWLFLKLV